MKNTIVSQAVYGVLDRAMNGAMYQAVKGPVNGVVLRDFQMTVIRIANQAVYEARIEDPPHPGLERYLAGVT